jgi:hypothetical protein
MCVQIYLFLRSIDTPVYISACGVLDIKLSIVGSAATQLVTYVIVLLQFRLGSKEMDVE